MGLPIVGLALACTSIILCKNLAVYQNNSLGILYYHHHMLATVDILYRESDVCIYSYVVAMCYLHQTHEIDYHLPDDYTARLLPWTIIRQLWKSVMLF